VTVIARAWLNEEAEEVSEVVDIEDKMQEKSRDWCGIFLLRVVIFAEKDFLARGKRV
jgi:NTP pyrophosphatase (non-canonical NTP hydrolase)